MLRESLFRVIQTQLCTSRVPETKRSSVTEKPCNTLYKSNLQLLTATVQRMNQILYMIKEESKNTPNKHLTAKLTLPCNNFSHKLLPKVAN